MNFLFFIFILNWFSEWNFQHFKDHQTTRKCCKNVLHLNEFWFEKHLFYSYLSHRTHLLIFTHLGSKISHDISINFFTRLGYHIIYFIFMNWHWKYGYVNDVWSDHAYVIYIKQSIWIYGYVENFESNFLLRFLNEQASSILFCACACVCVCVCVWVKYIERAFHNNFSYGLSWCWVSTVHWTRLIVFS